MMVSSKVITVQPAPGLAISSRAGDDRQQAATVGFIRDGDHRVTDPGVVRHRSVILDPLEPWAWRPSRSPTWCSATTIPNAA
jgi:hypothetical protein